jgi:4-hydroxy-tetrahydrodipicolinate reductase
MNIALIGYGNMGKEIERLAPGQNIAVTKIFTSKNNSWGTGLTKESLKDVDVCIDFSSPKATMNNVKAVAECGKNIVIGTTGWYNQLKEAGKIVRAKKTGMLYAPNFSLGMNIFSQILSVASEYFDHFDDYDVAISEVHHRGKADSPSGTALALGQIVLRNIHRKREVLDGSPRAPIGERQLHITSARVGSVVGTHSVVFDSMADSIELIHTAKNRNGFAIGALIAARWLGKKKGIYTMKDVISSL